MMQENFAVTDEDDRVAFTLRLDDLRQLVETPAFDPFVAQTRITAGVEDMVAYLATRRMRKLPVATATLYAPGAVVTPDGVAAVQAALQRYSDARIAEAARAIAINNFDGRAKLPAGLGISVLLVALLLILIWLLPAKLQPLAAMLAPVVTIASWAAIWNPVETLLYENWEERRSVQIYTCLRNLEITVSPTD